MGPGVRRDDPQSAPPLSIQRERLWVSAQVRWRAERLAVDRAIVVLATERWVPDRRRKCVVAEFAVARQYLGAGVEPGALGNVDPGARALLIRHIGTVRPVIDPAAVVVLALGLRVGRRHGEAD